MAPPERSLRLTVIAMAVGAWFILAACALLVWHFTAGDVPQALVRIVIVAGLVAVGGILASVAACCIPERRQPPDA